METPWIAAVVLLCVIADSVHGLECWQCMGESCNIEPGDNDDAVTTKCFQGQSCQKVYFEMLDDVSNLQYTSTVRGCASYCAPRDDFTENCTYQLRTTRGCVRKNCCHDVDLCNHGNGVIVTNMPYVILARALCVYVLYGVYRYALF